ncbi:MAG TPA: RHS repeat-associated core domain-containing protein [Acidisarcina sp.]
MGRLISAKTNGSSGYPQWGLSESYDRYGNRLNQAVTAGSGPSSNLSFGSNNQPTGYTFDSSGNMTVEPLSPPNNMTYDGENRMTAFSGIGGAASYTYDGNGLRVVKSVQSGTTTVSVFAGSSVIAEYDNGEAPTSPSREYIYNPAGGATTGLLAMISGGITTYYHQDSLSVRLTTNGSGSISTQDGTFPFGESWYQSGTSNKWIFTSYQRDSESGLVYSLARYYNSRTGTFCSADPLAGSPDDPQSWNRYPYGRNDPIDITDPSGKSWWSSLLIGAGVAAAIYFAPDIETFLGEHLGLALGDSAQSVLATPAANPGHAIGLLLRPAVQAAGVAGTEGAAAAGSGLGAAIAGGAIAAGAAQAVDQPKTQTPRGGCAQTVPGTASKYCGPLQDGLDAAKKALQRKKCNKFYGGQGAETLSGTTYRFLHLPDPTTGAATIDPSHVFVNSDGPYMNYTPTQGKAGPSVDFGHKVNSVASSFCMSLDTSSVRLRVSARIQVAP